MNEVPFPAERLAGDTLLAARRLIGARLVRGSGPNSRIGRIVEVEAYIGREDLASHARTGPTRRNATMFGPPGRAYVYLVYGMYHCLNVVTEIEGRPAAVLIRAVEPLVGADLMRAARLERLGRRSGAPAQAANAEERGDPPGSRLPDSRLASGPGLVCVAFSIDRSDDGLDLCDPASDLRLGTAPEGEALPIEPGPRVGIDYAPEPWLSHPWRFFVPGNASVSVSASRPRRPGVAR
jgi:DNA-3-methyladenine glycosylase